ncbi:hypothetical protein [Jiella pelagia]|uniref:DUF2188 domain-containing protein n=1 Tax=Jiella pelagia TaxID=2986949 RepID=A0ABY7BWV7_9HYPH|nr:hypothetical protein [Jiella pelagia]WAP67204.1 hypothetical protein OH818_16640 [Jiella pelagia]
MRPACTPASSEAPAATRFRIHYSDGDIRTIRDADPRAAREAGQRIGVTILKVKRDRTEEPR